jgi:hypothetical protein
MATSGTFAFIEALDERTSNNTVRWENSNVNPKTFNCEMKINNNSNISNVNVIIDKYNVVDKGVEGVCLNFAIIENNDEQKVLTSFVRCNNNADLEQYDVLNSLYEKVIVNAAYFDKILDLTMAF